MTSPRLARFFFQLCLLSTACSCTPTAPSEKSDSLDSLEEIVNTEVKKPIDDILELGLPEMLNAEVEYNEELPNPREYVDDYMFSEDKMAAALGIYGADALYLSLYKKTTEYIDYSNVCQRVANELGVGDTFSPEVMQRLEANPGNPDSIYTILSQSIREADNALMNEGKGRMAGLMATGSLVESLYYLCHSLNSPGISDGNLAKVRKAIIKQNAAVDRVLKRLQAFPQDKSLAEVRGNLEKLQAALSAIDGNQSKDQLKNLAALVYKMRADLVK